MWPFSGSKHNGRELVRDGALLLDVRTREEFQQGHIEGAVNVPVQELTGRLNDLGETSRAVVVYCRSGARSSAAAGMLANAGYQVLDIGGISNW